MPSRSMAIGIDIGGTNLRGARISAAGQILERVCDKSSPDPEIVLSRVIDMVRRLNTSDVGAVGIGVPGRVDVARRQILSGGYVNLASVDLTARIEEAARKPVFIDNDCNMALAGEIALGAATGQADVVMFTIGTGIGGATVLKGEVVRGLATAGQLGHITIDVNGLDCVCGRRGCVETTSSGTALGRHIAGAGLAAGTSVDDLLAWHGQGDAIAHGILDAWARPLRAAIDTAVAMFAPSVVVLGGGLGSAAYRALANYPAEAPWYQCLVVPALLGDDAGVIGAGLQALAHAAGKSGEGATKRAVLVNGIPASGKSTVSRGIADRTGWPILTLDTIKNPFLEHLGGGDRLFNRTLGQASYQAIWSLVRDAPAGSTFIVDAWFGFQPPELLEEHLKMAGVEVTAEVWCHAPGEVLGERYAARLDQRLPGHPGADYVPELIELAKRAAPLKRGPLLDVDTTAPIDFDAIVAWAETVLTTNN
jgi:glucokinase